MAFAAAAIGTLEQLLTYGFCWMEFLCGGRRKHVHLPDSTGSIDISQVRFLTDMGGHISGISALLDPDAPEIVFTRVLEKAPPPQQK